MSSRGFVSFLFLLGVASLWAGGWFFSPGLDENPSIRLLSIRRLEFETNVDTVIREELHAGLLAQLPDYVIEHRVNSKILDYVNGFPPAEDSSLTYEWGLSPLTQPNYLSLLAQPLSPVSASQLNAYSHVLVFPISSSVKYAEYTYTGGLFGTNAFLVKISSPEAQTLFTLPMNYRICVTSVQKDWPCFTGAEFS